MKRNRNSGKKFGKILIALIVFILSLLSYSLRWAKRNYANIGFAEIVFHLNLTFEGTSDDILKSYFMDALVPAVVLTVGILAVCLLITKIIKERYYLIIKVKKKKISVNLKGYVFASVFLIWFISIFMQAEQEFAIWDFCKNQIMQSNFIKEEYVAPESVEITFPEKKRNLINIYIESGETSFQDAANGGLCKKNYIPEMTTLAKENISFSHSDLLEGATVAPACGWTIAGLVAETSGLPLKLFGYHDTQIDNSMSNYDYFLPGATSIGDILEEQGYKNFFMAGSEFEFGGRTSYFTSHGNYEIWDYFTAIETGKIPEDYKVFWGFEDQKLYQFAKEELLKLSQNDQPFNFSLLTVDTHQPAGYVCDLCESEYEEQYANVWACASKQLDEFVNWIKEQEFYENTTIIVTGDHGSMSGALVATSYDKHGGSINRKVYNAFINTAIEPVNQKNRMFTTMDFFPTILASIGVEIEGNRLALGTNLFSEEPTLAEKYGYDVLFEELDKKSVFYDEKLLYP